MKKNFRFKIIGYGFERVYANKELDLMIKYVVGQGFEILWDG